MNRITAQLECCLQIFAMARHHRTCECQQAEQSGGRDWRTAAEFEAILQYTVNSRLSLDTQ